MQYDRCCEQGFYFLFFAHSKRQCKFDEAIEITQPESTVHKVKDLCRTQWIERIHALQLFKQLRSLVVACLDSISSQGTTKWTFDVVTDTTTLLLAISTTDFISAVVITTECLNYLLALTRSLQA